MVLQQGWRVAALQLFFCFFFLLSFFPFIKPTGAVAGISNETWRFGSVWLMGVILERALKLVNRDHRPVVGKVRHLKNRFLICFCFGFKWLEALISKGFAIFLFRFYLLFWYCLYELQFNVLSCR